MRVIKKRFKQYDAIRDTYKSVMEKMDYCLMRSIINIIEIEKKVEHYKWHMICNKI